MRTLALAVIAASLMASGTARAASVRILSAAAVGTGLKAVADLHGRRTGDTVTIDFATGPGILSRISSGENADLVVAPQAALKTLSDAGRLGGPAFELGRVGVGVAIRDGARRPAIATVDELKAAILAADRVIFSQGTSGTYVEGLFKRLGLDVPMAARTERPANGAAAVARIQAGTGNEIGLSALTELALGQGHGLTIVGPLPDAIQNFTTYSAAPGTGAAGKPSVAALVALLNSAESRAIMAASGVD